jgi:hypothetical protein
MRRTTMSLNISNELTQYAENIVMNIDFNKFTDRQIKNVVKQLRTGCISRGNSMTAHLARWIRKGHDFPHFVYDTYEFKWRDIPNGHPFFDTVKEVASLLKLSSTEQGEWFVRTLNDMIENAEEQSPTGSVSAYRLGEFKKQVKKAMKVEQELPKEVEDFLTGLQNRTLGVVPVSVYDISSYN